jgi:carbon storage regulator
MLVLRRKAGEAVLVDGRIEVQVLEISGSRVKLGFLAPPEVTVTRKEIVLTRDENLRAVAFRSADGLARLVSALHGSTLPRSGDGPDEPRGAA